MKLTPELYHKLLDIALKRAADPDLRMRFQLRSTTDVSAEAEPLSPRMVNKCFADVIDGFIVLSEQRDLLNSINRDAQFFTA